MNCIIFVEASNTGAGEVACAYAKENGFKVVLLCKNKSNYKKNILDKCHEVIEVDTTLFSEMLRVTELLSKQYDIKGITTTSDFFVVQTSQLAEYYRLPSNSPLVVDSIKNKYKMRLGIQKIDPFLNPKFAHANNLNETLLFTKEIQFPIIAKPINGNDSLHVKKINNFFELNEYFNNRDKWGQDVTGQNFEDGILLEECIGGDEYCLDLLKPLNGEIILIGAFKKKLSGISEGHFIKIGASFPIATTETNLLFEKISPVVKKLGYLVGAINIDCKIENGAVKILEMNPRLVGDQMGSHMIEISTGQNPAHAVVNMALGMQIDWLPTKSRGVAIHRLTMPESGYFVGIQNLEEIKSTVNVEFVGVLGEIGKWYDAAKSNQGVIGSIIVSHDSAELAMELATNLARNAKIAVSH